MENDHLAEKARRYHAPPPVMYCGQLKGSWSQIGLVCDAGGGLQVHSLDFGFLQAPPRPQFFRPPAGNNPGILNFHSPHHPLIFSPIGACAKIGTLLMGRARRRNAKKTLRTA